MAAKPTLAEVYAVINQQVEAYGNVMTTFQMVITEVGEIKTGLQELRQFVNEQFADAITARNIWQNNAEVYKAEAERLKVLLAQYQEGGAVPTVANNGR
jgi:hypothetical protein